MGGCYLLKYNGGDLGIKISVLYWRCWLIRVSVIRGSTVFTVYFILLDCGRSTYCCFTLLLFLYCCISTLRKIVQLLNWIESSILSSVQHSSLEACLILTNLAISGSINLTVSDKSNVTAP
jgi:hypothetical protein